MSSGFVRIEIKEVKVFEKLCGKDSTELCETKNPLDFVSYTILIMYRILSRKAILCVSLLNIYRKEEK